MAVDVDNPGRYELSSGVDPNGTDGQGHVGQRTGHRDDLAVGDQHLALFDPPARAVEHGCTGDQRRHARVNPVCRGVRVLVKIARGLNRRTIVLLVLGLTDPSPGQRQRKNGS